MDFEFAADCQVEYTELCQCGGRFKAGHRPAPKYLDRGGDYEHVSDGLAMNPSQIAAHRKLFPNVEVTTDGRPAFKSVRQREQYLHQVGMDKTPQRLRLRGQRIA
jgi:hypothetical protein